MPKPKSKKVKPYEIVEAALDQYVRPPFSKQFKGHTINLGANIIISEGIGSQITLTFVQVLRGHMLFSAAIDEEEPFLIELTQASVLTLLLGYFAVEYREEIFLSGDRVKLTAEGLSAVEADNHSNYNEKDITPSEFAAIETALAKNDEGIFFLAVEEAKRAWTVQFKKGPKSKVHYTLPGCLEPGTDFIKYENATPETHSKEA